MTRTNEKIEVSVVVPCFHSEATLAELVQQIHEVLEALELTFEIILVNDASADGTWQTIKTLAAKYPAVRGLELYFNTGQQRATLCGMEQSLGELVVTMDDDLQQPPACLPTLVNAIREQPDIDCVLGAYASKQHNWIRNIGTAAMNHLFQMFYNKPKGIRTTTFRIMRRSLVEAALQHATTNPNVNPLIFRSTRRIANVEVEHHARLQGRSGYGVYGLVRLLLDNVLSVSALPLQLVSVIGVFCLLASMALGTYYLYLYGSGQVNEPGFTTVVLLVIFFGGVTLFSIGLLGEYMIRIMDEVKGRPRYILRDTTDRLAKSKENEQEDHLQRHPSI